jgi:hypothetical protein
MCELAGAEPASIEGIFSFQEPSFLLLSIKKRDTPIIFIVVLSNQKTAALGFAQSLRFFAERNAGSGNIMRMFRVQIKLCSYKI